MSKGPILSIIMPVYNSGAFVGAAIESILYQTFEDYELIIIDDGSTDNSLNIINQYKDPRIIVFANEVNKGIVFSRNFGLNKANGKYIAPFDSDDIALPRKFEIQIGFLESNSDFGMVGSWTRLIDENGKFLKKKWRLSASPEAIPAILLFRNYFAQSSVVLRSEVIPDFGYQVGYDIGEDYLMWVTLSKEHKIWNLPYYLVYCRVHKSNSSTRDFDLLRQYDARIYKQIFKPLGIDLNSRNLDTILKIKYNEGPSSLNDIKDAENLFTLIIDRNRTARVFNEKHLVKVILNRWAKAFKNIVKHQPLLMLPWLRAAIKLLRI